MIRSFDEMYLTSFAATVGPLVNNVGWRQTYRVLGSVSLVVGAAAAWMLRSDPEEYGLLPDGNNHPAPASSGGGAGGSVGSDELKNNRAAAVDGGRSDITSSNSTPISETDLSDPDWTFDEVIRTFFFWKLLLLQYDALGLNRMRWSRMQIGSHACWLEASMHWINTMGYERLHSHY
jgi:hypothetical protein